MAAIDYQTTLERFGFDLDLFREMAELMRSDVPVRLAHWEQAVRGGDIETALFEIHALKGMVAAFDARRAVEAATAAELSMRQQRRLPDAATLDEVREALAEVTAALEAHLAAAAASTTVRESERTSPAARPRTATFGPDARMATS